MLSTSGFADDAFSRVRIAPLLGAEGPARGGLLSGLSPVARQNQSICPGSAARWLTFFELAGCSCSDQRAVEH